MRYSALPVPAAWNERRVGPEEWRRLPEQEITVVVNLDIREGVFDIFVVVVPA